MELLRTESKYYAPQCMPMSTFQESSDAIVPDTFPDMGHIVCAQGMVSLKDIMVQNDRVLLSGVVNVNLLYQPETVTTLRKLSIPISFAHIAEYKGLTAEAHCQVSCKLATIDAKTVNSRKVSVTVQVAVESTAFLPQKLQLTQTINHPPETLQMRGDCLQKRLITQVFHGDFTILEDITVAGGNYLEVLHTDATVTCTERQVVGDRVVLKGDVVLDLLCMDDDDRLQTMQHKLRFSQVVEANVTAESDALEVGLSVYHIDCMMRGEGMLAVGVGVRATVLTCVPTTLSLLRDCYDTAYLSTCKTATVQVHALESIQPHTVEVSCTLPLQRQANEIVRTQALCTGVRKGEGNGWTLSLQVHCLCTDGQDAVWSMTRSTTCPITLPQGTDATQLRNIALQPLSAQGGKEELTLRMQCTLCAYACQSEPLTDITAVELEQARPQPNGKITLLLAYVQTRESLWDIAKKHASTMQQIRVANGLEPTTDTVEDCMLLIPICAG